MPASSNSVSVSTSVYLLSDFGTSIRHLSQLVIFVICYLAIVSMEKVLFQMGDILEDDFKLRKQLQINTSI